MYLNGYKIDWVKNWSKKAHTDVKEAEAGRYIVPKFSKNLDVENKVIFRVNHKQTALQLKELFTNPLFNTVVVSDFYIEEYNGIYQMVKGNISQDDSRDFWEGTMWLENKSDNVRWSIYQDTFEDDYYEYLQSSTSNMTSLLNYTIESGSFSGTAGINGISAGVLSFGYDYWNSYQIDADITFDSGTSEIAGFAIAFQNLSNYYQVSMSTSTSYDVKLIKIVDGVSTTLATTSFDTALQPSFTYSLQVVFSGRRIDVYVDTVHVFSIYDRSLVSGKVGLYAGTDTPIWKNVSVKRYYPPTISIPSGYENTEEPHDPTYLHSDGILANYVNVDNGLINKMYASRVLKGEVKVWDTMGNNFNDVTVTPKPILWQRVYDVSHEFKGDMFVENGIFGILYTSENIYHFIFDEPYKQGQWAWLDFKQTPNYEIWDESFVNGHFLSYNAGERNWNEDGLMFERVPYNQTMVDKDIVNTGYLHAYIPDFGNDNGHIMDYVVEIKFKPDDTLYQAGYGYYLSTLVGNAVNGSIIPFIIYYDYASQKILIGTVKSTPTSGSYYYSTPTGSILSNEWHHLKIYKLTNVHGFLIYHNGILLSNLESVGYNYEHYLTEGRMDVGNSNSYTWVTLHFHGIIQYARIRNLGNSIATYKTVEKPVVYHSFDENTWDSNLSKFVGKGSATLQLFAYGSLDIRNDGRYSQCIGKIGSTDRLSGSFTTQLDNVTGYTAQFWMKWDSTVTPVDGDKIIRVYNASTTERLFDFYMTSTKFEFVAYDGTTFYSVGIGHSVHTVHTDDKWHHIAMTWDGTNLTSYIDGAVVGTRSDLTSNPCPLPSDILIGYGVNENAFQIDEFQVHNYALQPIQFGSIVTDAFDTRQWYSKSEVERVDGKLRARENPIKPSFEMEFTEENSMRMVDRVNNLTVGEYQGSSNKDLYIRPAYTGLGISKYDGSRLMFQIDNDNVGDEFRVRRDKDWTIQMYVYLDTLPQSISKDFYLLQFRQDSAGLTRYDVMLSSDGNIYLYADNSTYTFGTNPMIAKTPHHLVFTMKYDYEGASSGTTELWIDGTLVGSLSIDSLYNSNDLGGGYNYIGLFETAQNFRGWVSNFMFHQAVLPTGMWGIEVDYEKELPQYYAYIYNALESTYPIEYKLKSITPELVDIDLYPLSNTTIRKVKVPSWIESGSFLYKWDFLTSKFNNSTLYNQTFTYYIYHEKYRPRASVILGNSTKFYDLGLLRAGQNVSEDSTSSENHLIAFHNEANRMLLVIGSTKYTGTKYYLYHTDGRISQVQTPRIDGVQFAGLIPQRHLNYTFLDATAMTYPSGVTYDSTTTGTWFRSLLKNVTLTYVTSTGTLLNYKRYRRGMYMVIANALSGSSGWSVRAYDETDGSTIAESAVSLSGSYVTTTLYFHVNEFNEDHDIDIQVGSFSGAGGTLTVDKIFVLPITDGEGMVLDLISQQLGKREKQKVLH